MVSEGIENKPKFGLADDQDEELVIARPALRAATNRAFVAVGADRLEIVATALGQRVRRAST